MESKELLYEGDYPKSDFSYEVTYSGNEKKELCQMMLKSLTQFHWQQEIMIFLVTILQRIYSTIHAKQKQAGCRRCRDL
ncbi:MAG: hypothetical protein ACLUI5_05760 [Fusicatenibacter saccharivorans]